MFNNILKSVLNVLENSTNSNNATTVASEPVAQAAPVVSNVITIKSQKFGCPIPVRVKDNTYGDVELLYNGEFSLEIVDYYFTAGTQEEIVDHFKNNGMIQCANSLRSIISMELYSAIHSYGVSKIMSYQREIINNTIVKFNEEYSDKGIKLIDISMLVINFTPESLKKIKEIDVERIEAKNIANGGDING